MEFKKVLETRRSVRKFKPVEIPEETIQEILQLAQLAPSAGNIQAYKVKIVKSQEEKEKLKEATFSKQQWVASAPVVLVICACSKESAERFKERGENLYAVQDATIFASYLQLILASMNLASVWVGAFAEDDVRSVLSLSENLRPIIMLPCGQPDEESRPRERKNLDDIII